MKLARFNTVNQEGVGLVVDGGIVDIGRRIPRPRATLQDLIANWVESRPQVERLQSCEPDFALGEVTLRAPIPRPGKIFRYRPQLRGSRGGSGDGICPRNSFGLRNS